MLTSDVLGSFRAFDARFGAAEGTVEAMLAGDALAARALVEHECGRLDDEGFESVLAWRLAHRGVRVAARGLLRELLATVRPDIEMLAVLARMRAHGIPVAVVSNQLGRDLYAGCDLDDLADEVVLSSRIGVRKPSRRIFAIACRRLDRRPRECVMVDDLAHNLVGAARLGIRGVRHVDAATTASELAELFDVELAMDVSATPTPGGCDVL